MESGAGVCNFENWGGLAAKKTLAMNELLIDSQLPDKLKEVVIHKM